MDIQKILDNHIAAGRAEAMKTSNQLMLGELINKLLWISNRNKPIVFDFGGMKPFDVSSWRGSYGELAVEYALDGQLTAEGFLQLLKESVGESFTGYKGGDFVMGKNTPVWVAKWGESSVPNYKGDSDYITVGVVDVEDGNVVTIKTQHIEY